MNPGSLKHYKDQVYNPGSPNPNPKSSPLRSLPKQTNFDSLSINPENPLKLVFSASKRKKSSSSESSPSPKKKTKMMDPEEMKQLTENITAAVSQSVSKAILQTLRDNQDETKQDMLDLNVKIDNLTKIQEKSADDAKAEKNATEARFQALEKQMDEMRKSKVTEAAATDTEAIEEVVKSFVDKSSDGSWKANLAKEVFEHEHGVIIHGIRFDCTDENTKKKEALAFLKNELKASEDLVKKVKIKEVVRLGADNGAGKPPPILIKFGHPTERNQILPLSSNLSRGISMDKNIPKLYQQKHKEFKKLAWKLKTIHDVQSQVIFDSFTLVLRYKKKDEGANKYNFVNEKEWYPKPGEIPPPQTKGLRNDPNKHETPAIDISKHSESNKVVIVTGVHDTINGKNVKTEFLNFFEENDREKILDIRYKAKGTVVLTCKDWASCKLIADSYEKKSFHDEKITFHLFSEDEPE